MKIIIKRKAKKAIEKHMKKNGLCYTHKIDEEIISKINDILTLFKPRLPEITIVITADNGLNAHNLFSCKSYIRLSFTWLWAYLLTFDDSPKMDDAFILTFGNELGHSVAKTYIPFFFISKLILNKSSKYDMFRLQSIEVFCDYYGKVFSGLDIHNAVDAKKYYYQYYDTFQRVKSSACKTDFVHPSHERRLVYMEKDFFDIYMLRTIADDIGYNNTKVINFYSDYFREVQKHDSYVIWYHRILSLLSIFTTLIIFFLLIIIFSYFVQMIK